MKKNSTVAKSGKQIFKGKKLTIGMDLGDRFTYRRVRVTAPKSWPNSSPRDGSRGRFTGGSTR